MLESRLQSFCTDHWGLSKYIIQMTSLVILISAIFHNITHILYQWRSMSWAVTIRVVMIFKNQFHYMGSGMALWAILHNTSAVSYLHGWYFTTIPFIQIMKSNILCLLFLFRTKFFLILFVTYKVELAVLTFVTSHWTDAPIYFKL